jgi:hypothetical protein
MSDAKYGYGTIRNDDGTRTFGCIGETVGSIRIENLTDVEMSALAAELRAAHEAGDGTFEPTLIKWAEGYRNGNP